MNKDDLLTLLAEASGKKTEFHVKTCYFKWEAESGV